MRRMVLVGSQTINKRSPAATKPLDQAMLHKQIQNPINRHTVYRCGALQGLMYIPGRKRKIIVTQNLQYANAVFSNFKFALL